VPVNHKVAVATCLLFVSSLFISSPAVSQDLTFDMPTKRIVYIYDGDSTYFDDVYVRLKEELIKISKGKYNPEFMTPRNGGWDRVRIDKALQQSLSDPAVDLIIGAGFLFVKAIQDQLPPSKPVIIAGRPNAAILGLPSKGGCYRSRQFLLFSF